MDVLACSLAEKTEFAKDGIISKALLDESFGDVTLFTFAKGLSLSEHTSTRPAVIHILSGNGRVKLGDDWHGASAGSWFFMPPQLVHAIQADEEMVMLLTLFSTVG